MALELSSVTNMKMSKRFERKIPLLKRQQQNKNNQIKCQSVHFALFRAIDMDDAHLSVSVECLFVLSFSLRKSQTMKEEKKLTEWIQTFVAITFSVIITEQRKRPIQLESKSLCFIENRFAFDSTLNIRLFTIIFRFAIVKINKISLKST